MAPSPVDVQKALKGADYPASRDDLIDLARENEAPDDVVDELEDQPRGRRVRESCSGDGGSRRLSRAREQAGGAAARA